MWKRWRISYQIPSDQLHLLTSCGHQNEDTFSHTHTAYYFKPYRIISKAKMLTVSGGLEVACWPLVPKFAGSNPTEAVKFFRAKKKSSARLPSEGK